MKKISIALSVLILVALVPSCEGSFESNGEDPIAVEPTDTLSTFQINLLAPENRRQCLTEGEDGNGNWIVRFDWAIEGTFDGDFTILLTEVSNRNRQTTQNLNPGSDLTLEPNTWYTWQIRADDSEEESEVFTFVTPATRGEATSPPTISAITVTQDGGGHLIEFIIADDDLSEVELLINGALRTTFNQVGPLSWMENNMPTGDVEIKVIAEDNSNFRTEQTRVYSN